MNEALDRGSAAAALPRLSLLAMLEAAHALRLSGALPALPGIAMHRLAEAGGMRPWIRLALGEDAALALERDGRGGWCLDALLGEPMGCRQRPVVSADPVEVSALIVVDALCAEAGSPRWSVWHGIRSRIPFPAAERLVPALYGQARDGEARPDPTGTGLEAVLDRIAALHGLKPRKAPADLSSWREREAVGTVVGVTPRAYYATPPGAVMQHEGADILLEDGRTASIHAGDPLCWPGVLILGQRVHLTWRGATAGHPGYLARGRLLTFSEESLASFRASQREVEDPPFHDLLSLDRDGRALGIGLPVTLLYGCLEAGEGDHGRVVETCGTMASNRPDGR